MCARSLVGSRRSPSTISRELRRNASTRTWRLEYRASTAQWHAERRARRPKAARLVTNERLRGYVQDRLAGVIRAADGSAVVGPAAPWKGRNKPHRQDRRWATAWSPEQIANRLPVDFPDDESMRISHEAIYQALYVQGRGALKRELVACLRTGRALRVPRARARKKPGGHVTAEVMISERPAEADERAVPAIGRAISSSGSTAPRSAPSWSARRGSRCSLHLPRMDGYGIEPRVQNGPALAGYGAEAMRDALASRFTTLPEQLRRSLTWDRGKELAQHAQLKIDTGLADLLRRPAQPLAAGDEREHQRAPAPILPEGHRPVPMEPRRDRSRRRRAERRPRKTLGWKTPAEALDDHLRSLQQAGVATTS